jgi:outer membrane beta-barrel protein
MCAALATLAPQAARGSAADAFENKVKPVSNLLYGKAGKLEITPLGSFSLDDAFFAKYMGGLKLGYHFNEYLSVNAGGAYGTTSTTGSTNVCPKNTACRPATQAELNQVPGEIKWMASGEFAFSPVYGKLNIFGEKAIHLDLSLLVGVDLVNYRDVLKTGETTPGQATSVGGHIGVGTRIFLARFVALRIEFKDVIYQVSSLQRAKLQNQLFVDAGLSFFIPVVHRDER